MAAQPWAFYYSAKKKIGNGQIDLDGGVFRMSLHTSASNASASVGAITVLGSVTNEISARGGYAAGGRALSGVIWTLQTDSVKFDATDLVFTASLSNLNNVKYAVISWSAASGTAPLLCYSRLSSSQFTVTSGNTLTIQFAEAGIFTLT